ncbi:hypothetical protein EV385_6156 [Krasilnikovia cinnamomea]|uniref:Uncharacterized protein n=1 Tax=Krasilnikovia cinnamomea TaxID=349313 RepID=A0A4Q7ZSN4_9ACTN|nr:hypothetical protein [Krasilnikovia cinnamomea]RZU54208.1 hypothetical protein EV385_6156 [Krasilnikovia cinnamomea]
MRLTGIPLLVLAGAATLIAAAATVYAWPRGGRLRRVLTRTVGVVVVEALLVSTIFLGVNRDQSFYPSWDALAGGSGAGDATPAAAHPSEPPPVTGRFGPAVRGWHLAEPPTVVTPAGYAARPGTTYPVIVVLTAAAHLAEARTAAQRTPGVVTVLLVPTALTSATALANLAAELRRAARAADQGWALVTDPPHQALAGQMRGADRHFGTAFGVVGAKGWAAALAAAAEQLPHPLASPLRP